MKCFLKIVLICLTIVMAFATHEGVDAQMKPNYLPRTIGAWTRPESPEIINSDNIFKYMNGAGELYLGYRFDHLEVFDYTSENQENILVELYFMETSDDAFGLLSLDWGGEPVSFDGLPAKSSDRLPKALYGAGLLRVWSDNLYIRIMASHETPASKQAVLDLGKAVTADRKNSPEPELLKFLAPDVDSGWKLRRDRQSFFRSHLALNSVYYLSHANILDFDLSAEAVIASYEQVAAKEPIRSQFLLVKYENRARAFKALNHFHDAYLPDHKKEIIEDSSAKNLSLFKIEDGWTGYKLIDNYAVIVFKCPDRKSARTIINKNEVNLEGNHKR
ncbi:hypothetical protein QUF90_19380 [Desulfococcaceae bacterium HSG9]|nr:hypothetical protein [Desulfococcaceae bacterium HSG9]